MIARSAIGWQTMLADLSLILFMVTAAAMAEPSAPPRPVRSMVPAAAFSPAATPTSAALNDPPLTDRVRAQPVAIWREAPGGVGLAPWLASQQVDSRQQLTITVHYPPAGQARALSDATRLIHEAGMANPRIIMEPDPAGTPIAVLATLAYDRTGPL